MNSKLSGRDKRLSGCVPRLITVLARKIRLVVKGWIKNAMTSTKTSIFKFFSKQNSAGVNRGFRVVNNTMYTYTQVRDAFSNFYPKRKVLLEDGVSKNYRREHSKIDFVNANTKRFTKSHLMIYRCPFNFKWGGTIRCTFPLSSSNQHKLSFSCIKSELICSKD